MALLTLLGGLQLTDNIRNCETLEWKLILQYKALFIISWSLVIVQDYKLPSPLVTLKYRLIYKGINPS